jgi:hypothetical protein
MVRSCKGFLCVTNRQILVFLTRFFYTEGVAFCLRHPFRLLLCETNHQLLVFFWQGLRERRGKESVPQRGSVWLHPVHQFMENEKYWLHGATRYRAVVLTPYFGCGYPRCDLCVLCASVVKSWPVFLTTKSQRTLKIPESIILVSVHA